MPARFAASTASTSVALDTEDTSESELQALRDKLDEKMRKSRDSMRKACSKASRLGRRVREKPDEFREALRK